MRISTHPKSLFFFTLYISVILILAILGSFYRGYTLNHDQARHAYNKGAYFLTNIEYLNLPRVNVRMPGSSPQASPLKIRADISIEIKKEYTTEIENYIPRIADRVTEYFYAQPAEKLSNLHNQKIIRREMLDYVNNSSNPVPIVDVVFRQYVVL